MHVQLLSTSPLETRWVRSGGPIYVKNAPTGVSSNTVFKAISYDAIVYSVGHMVQHFEKSHEKTHKWVKGFQCRLLPAISRAMCR